jgi:hypothetical protein
VKHKLVTIPKLISHVLTALQVSFFALTLHHVSEELDSTSEVDEELQTAGGAVLGSLAQNAAEHTECLRVVKQARGGLRAFNSQTNG